MDSIVTIKDLLVKYSNEYPMEIGLKYEDEVYNYSEINSTVNKIANSLLKLNVNHGDKVALLLTNRPEFLFSWFATNKIGAIEVPVNTAYKDEFLSYILNNSQAKVLITEASFVERVKDVLSEMKYLEAIIICESIVEDYSFQSVQFLSFERLLIESQDLEPQVTVKPTDLAAFIYTSGTTGPPKGVKLTHQYFYYMATDNLVQRNPKKDDVFYTCLPLFHTNAQGLTTLPAFYGKIPLALGKRFSASNFWNETRKHKATQINGIGAMLSILMKQPPKPNDKDVPVRLAFIAPVPKELFKKAEERWNMKVFEGFGLTESGVIAYQPLDNPRPGSFGKALPGYEIKIVDKNDNEVPANTVGEIITRPKRAFSMMEGYYNMPEATLEAFKNLWFHTGDYGMQDEDGYFYFVDRKKDVIRRRGENISSFEIERAVTAHPNVYEVAAIAVPSDLGEDDVKVLIQFKENKEVPYDEMIRWMEKKLPDFMVPRYLEYVDSFPKTPTERIEKYKLRNNSLNKNTWDRELNKIIM